MLLGKQIQKIRKREGLTQAELGRRLGVSGSMIGQWEGGHRVPKFETIIAIADALNVSASQLMKEAGAFVYDPEELEALDSVKGGPTMSIGSNIRRYRKRAGMTQQELAQKSGLAVNTIRLYESEKRSPNGKLLEAIGAALGVSASDLLTSSNSSQQIVSADKSKYVKMLRHYQADLSTDLLLDEAITTLENYFSYMDKEALMHFSRPLAIAYLALKHEQDKKSAE